MIQETPPPIPLQFACIGWTPTQVDPDFNSPRVIITDRRTELIPRRFSMTGGAVFAWWENPRTPQYKRLLELLWLRGQMCADGVPMKDIEAALDRIPEYVQWLNDSADLVERNGAAGSEGG